MFSEYFAVNPPDPRRHSPSPFTEAGTVLHTGDIKLDQLPLGRPVPPTSGDQFAPR